MRVEEIMNQNPLTIEAHVTVDCALQKLLSSRVRHLPVIENERLVGIVSDRDILKSVRKQREAKNEGEKVRAVMSTSLLTAHPHDAVEELAGVFYEQQIGCIPVTENDRCIGTITERDMLYALIQLTGAHQPGSLIEIEAADATGMLARASTIISEKQVNISSVLVYPGETEETKIVVFRIQTMNPLPVVGALQENGFKIRWPRKPGVDRL